MRDLIRRPSPGKSRISAALSKFWHSDGSNNLHGTVLNAKVLEYNDKLAVWINNNATKTQQFRALQDSEYNTATNTAYDESLTISTALGSVLGPLYVKGTESGKLPLVQALINSSNGTAGAYVSTTTAKAHYSYPRPYLPTDPNGNLKINRVADVTDTTHEFSPNNVALSPGYGTASLCTGGSIPPVPGAPGSR